MGKALLYEVVLVREVRQSAMLHIEAESSSQANALALEYAAKGEDVEWSTYDIDDMHAVQAQLA